MSGVVKLAAERPSARDAADIFRQLAEMADRGEIVAATIVYEERDGTMRNWQSALSSPTKMSGALLDAAIRRLGFEVP